jgi:tape measure domain-containing protein
MAQLELSVVLNLANFRTQLGKLAQASAAYYYPINLTIDKQAFKKQLAALGNIKPVIKIEDSQLDGARARIATLNKSLATLRRATSTAIEIKVKYKEEGRPAAGTGAVGRAITGRAGGEEALANKSRGELQKLYGLFREANLRVGELSKSLTKSSAEEIRQSLVPAFSDSGEEAVNGLAIGLKDPSSKISKAAKRLTVITIQDVKKGFGIASPSRVFKEIGKDLVAGLEIGFEDFNELKTKMVGKMRQLVSAIKKEVKVGGITMGGLLSPIARPTGASTRTLPGVVSPTRRGESADPGRGNQKILNSLSLLTGNPALYRGRMANLGAERLPSSLLGAAQSQFQLEELAPSFKQARLASGVSPVDKIIDEAFFGRGTLPKAQSALSTLSNSLERLGSTTRAALPSGILQSASGNARMRRFGGVAPGESMGIFEPTARPTAYPPSGGFLEFSRRATAISAGLPGNVFGGRGGGGVPPSGGGGGGFPSDGGLGGRQGPATFIGAGSQMEKFKTVLDVATASTQNFRASQIPLIGGLKNLAGEFGQAAKQVLLYGTAYKGLAFLTSLPGQILNAAKSQQQFTNGLKVATQDTGTFAKELLYVDNVQRAFGLNLETTRTGFTRLYASMAPTGFDSGSIEKLFTGISAATASLQLTPDKAERVIYAFGQMASKGQIMSEELKGQLGDVLPGALAIFSKAAGMSVKEFSKAMEDGEFVGDRFREVFAKVSDELMKRFGTGAAAAGKSLQGLINTVGGDFQRTLESFAPLANAAAQATLGPLAGMLKEVSMAAQIAMGEQDRVRKQLEAAQADVSTLKAGGADAKEIKDAERNVAALAAKYEVLNEAARDPAIAQQVKNIETFVTEVQKAATFTMNLAGVIGSALNPLLSILGGNFTSIVGNIALLVLGFNAIKLATLLFTGTLTTMNAVVAAGGSISTIAAAKNTILAGALRLVGVQATGAQIATIGFGAALKGLLISTGIGALVVLLGSLAASAFSVGDAFSAAAAKTKQSMDEMKNAVSTGNVALAKSQLSQATQSRNDIEEQVRFLEEMKALGERQGGGGRPVLRTSLARRMALEAAGFDLKGKQEPDLNDLLGQIPGRRADALNLEQRGVVSVRQAETKAGQLGLNKPTPGVTPPETPDEDKTKTSLESYYSLQDQLAKAQTQADIDRIEAAFEHRKELINNLYDLEETRANSIQKEAIDHQRAISNIFLDLQKKQIDARLSVMKAEGSVAGGAPTGPGGSLAGMTQYITGDPSHPSYKPDHGTIENYHDHLAFASREAAIEAYNKLTKSGIQVTEFQGFGQGVTGPHSGPGSAHHKGLAMDVPGTQWGGSGVIGAREFAGSARVRATLGMGGGVGATPGKVTPDTKRDVLAEQAKLLAGKQAAVSLTHAEVEAQQKLVIETEKYLAQIFGIAEKELQTSMLQKKTAMLRAGATDQEIEDAMSIEELNLKYVAGIEAANAQIVRNKALKDQGAISQDELNKRNDYQNFLIGELNKELPKAIKAQTDLNQAQKDAPLLQRIRDLKEEIKLLFIINDIERRREELRKEYGGDEKKIQEIIDLEAIKKNIEDTRALISDFVSSTASDYKGFLKAVISGEDAVDALKQFQEGLKDKVLTIFLDFAMAPVEKFLKESLEGLFLPKAKKEDGKLPEATTKDPVEATNINTTATNANTVALEKVAGVLTGAAGQNQSADIASIVKSIGLSSGIDTSLNGLGGPAPVGFDAASVFGNPEALTGAFGGVQASISESMNDIVSSFENGASSLGNALPAWDTALATNIPDALKTSTNETDKATPTFQESLGKVTAGIGIAAGAIMGIAAGISQIKEGGTSNVLGGIGSVLMSLGGAVGGFAGFFKGANGGVAGGGWKPFPVTAFANGGMVNGPTLGLVGEGKYNEAIVPLPDGRSIPVQMKGGGGGLREAMSGSNGRASGSPILNMSFQSTNINGVEYVSRDQLEAAMAQTRKQASRDGANRGMSMTLDKLQQSPQTRNRLGMR